MDTPGQPIRTRPYRPFSTETENFTIRDIPLHPTNHHPSTLATTTFDAIVIGAGPVGNFAAARLSKAGLSVLVIESELYGGDCPYWACVPSKALLRPAEALDAALAVQGAKEIISGPDVDVAQVFARRDKFVFGWKDDFLLGLADANGVTAVRGKGRIHGAKRVTVEPFGENKKYEFEAKHAIIVATGSEPVYPDISGLDGLKEGEELWTSREANAANAAPEHLVIIGAGVVGAEMATAYSRFGGKVTLISASPEVLPRCEPQAGRMVRETLISRGVDVELSTRPTKVKRLEHKDVVLTLDNGKMIACSTILISTGRVARTSDIGLETIGIEGDGKALVTDESLAVPISSAASGSWLYAIGDVNARAPFTHMGTYHARIAANAILSRLPTTLSSTLKIPKLRTTEVEIKTGPTTIPQVIVTSPSIAIVGLTYAEAQKCGLSVREVSVDFGFPGALLYGVTIPEQGWARWVVETSGEEERLVGATFVCEEASDLVHASTVAITGGIGIKTLVHAVPSFPTRSEIYRRLLDAAGY